MVRRRGLAGQVVPRADALLEKSQERRLKVGDDLYDSYKSNRAELVRHLCNPPHNKPLDTAIRIAQKLLDRIIFMAFCQELVA